MASQIRVIAAILAFGVTCAAGNGFCYSDGHCGPYSEAWTTACTDGLTRKHQSPIDLLPAGPGGTTILQLSQYKGSHFRIQNNGHSLAFDFDNQGPSAGIISFPDAAAVNSMFLGLKEKPGRQYKFASGHFHWGKNDLNGSEHTVGLSRAAMELHLVHYLASYSSMADAVASGDPNALTVLGVMIDVSILENLYNAVSGQGDPTLAPIVRHLKDVKTANHDEFTTINEPLDLTPMLRSLITEVYSYHGSLTTPGCNEQVNWFVLKDRAHVASKDVAEFRTLLDSTGAALTENHRPPQPRNDRFVWKSIVKERIVLG